MEILRNEKRTIKKNYNRIFSRCLKLISANALGCSRIHDNKAVLEARQQARKLSSTSQVISPNYWLLNCCRSGIAALMRWVSVAALTKTLKSKLLAQILAKVKSAT